MKLCEVLKCWREDQRPRLGLRAAAKEIGISPATLSRIERGDTPDWKTVKIIWSWLTLPNHH